MKKKIFVAMLGLFLAGLLTAEGNIDFTGEVKSLWGVSAPWTDQDLSAGRFTLGNTSFTGKIDAYYDKSTAYAEATFDYDANALLSGRGTGLGNLGSGFNLALGEAWLDYTDSFWGLRIGRQKASWGKADGINITNILCPADMSNLDSMTRVDSNLPVDAVRFSLTGSQFTLDAWWIPFFTPASLPLEDGNILRKYLVPENVKIAIPSSELSLTIPINIGEFEIPERAVWNGEYGLKFSGYFSSLDLSLYAFYGWDDIPILDYEVEVSSVSSTLSIPTSINIQGDYKNMAMFGADAALPIGETVLRLESAFFPMRHFQKKSTVIVEEKMSSSDDVELSLERNQISALAGIDWMPSEWTLTAQYFMDYVMGDLDSIERDYAYKHGLTLTVIKKLMNDNLELKLVGLIGLNDFDSMLKPSLSYSLSDQIKVGADLFLFMAGPEEDGKYGAYKDLSSFCINARFSF